MPDRASPCMRTPCICIPSSVQALRQPYWRLRTTTNMRFGVHPQCCAHLMGQTVLSGQVKPRWAGGLLRRTKLAVGAFFRCPPAEKHNTRPWSPTGVQKREGSRQADGYLFDGHGNVVFVLCGIGIGRCDSLVPVTCRMALLPTSCLRRAGGHSQPLMSRSVMLSHRPQENPIPHMNQNPIPKTKTQKLDPKTSRCTFWKVQDYVRSILSATARSAFPSLHISAAPNFGHPCSNAAQAQTPEGYTRTQRLCAGVPQLNGMPGPGALS